MEVLKIFTLLGGKKSITSALYPAEQEMAWT